MIKITKEDTHNYLIDESGVITVVKGHSRLDNAVLVKFSGRLTNDASTALNRLSGSLNRNVMNS